MNRQELIELIKEQDTNNAIRQELLTRKRARDVKLAKKDYLKYLMLTHNYIYKFDQYRHTVIASEILEKVNDGDINRLMIYSPPQHLKSTYATQSFPGYYLGNHKNNNVITLSYNADFAMKFGDANRKKIIEYGHEIFNVSVEQGNNSKTDWKLAGYKGAFHSSGMVGGITGHTGDLIMIDDPIGTREQAESKTQRNKIIDEWTDSIRSRLNPESRVVLIMTPWHEMDLGGYLLASEGEKWTVLFMPAEAREDDSRYLKNKYGCNVITLDRNEGELLWEKQGMYGFTKEFYKGIKKDSRTWNSLYQCRPTTDDGGQFKRTYFQYFTETDAHYILETENGIKRFEKSECTKFITVDTALKDKQVNDPTSMTCFVETPEKDILILDNLTDRIIVPKQYNTIRNFEARHNPKYVAIEDKQSGTGIIQQAQLDGKPFKTLKADTSKMARATNIMIKYENKKVYHKKYANWLSEVEEQLLQFPNGKHDDIVDTISYAGILTTQTEGEFWFI
jgi:predicted phage terminase large subunit-like protein